MGPVSAATLVQSWADYVTQFGGLYGPSWLGYAVNQFFANGGSECYIVRLVWAPGMTGGVNSPMAAQTALASGVGYGTATITATLGALTGTLTLGLGTPLLQTVSVAPQGMPGTDNIPPLPFGATLALAATGTYSDGSTATPAAVAWTTSDDTIATVLGGVVTAGTNAGTVTITATSGYFAGSTTLTVTAANVKSITVSPATVKASVGQTVQLSASLAYSDGTTADITGIAAFTCPKAITFVSTQAQPLSPGQFLATAIVAPGTLITAALPAIWTLPAPAPTAVTATLTVVAASVVSMAISPANATMPLPANLTGTQALPTAFTLATTLTDGTSGTAPGATWTSSNPAVAGFATAMAAPISKYAITGNVATFTYGGATPLTVGEPVTLSGFATSTFLNNQVVIVLATGLTATTFQAKFTHVDVAATAEVGTATVAAGSLVVSGTGTTTITASYTPGGASVPITASTQLTVSPGGLATLSLSPATLTLAAKLTKQLTLTGTFDNGTFVNMTGYATWSSSAPLVATVSATGVVTALSAGSAIISAAWLGTTASLNVTATAAIPQSISITAPGGQTSLAANQTLNLTADLIFSDSSAPQDVTGTATWTSSSPALQSAGLGVVKAQATVGGTLTLFASNPGAWGNNLRLTVTPQPPTSALVPGRFGVLVQRVVPATGQTATLESFQNLSIVPTDPTYAVTVINNDSSYITFINPLKPNDPLSPPAATPSSATAIALTGGADGTLLQPTDTNFELAMFPADPTQGVHLLDSVDIFNLLCVPGETDAVTISLLQAYCVSKRAFMIVDSPPNTTIASMSKSGPVGSTAGSITDQSIAGNSAMYFPWIEAPDPLAANRPRLFPPCGFVAGLYAQTDATRGVWKAPAGIQAALIGNSGLQFVLTDLQHGQLNPQGVNCLRSFKVYGDVVWGARTLAGNDQAGSQWKHVPIRRLALFIESSLYDATQWVVFEPNDSTLWGQIRMNVGTFMQGLFLQGAFAGTTPSQAYLVKCDADVNPPANVALGLVTVQVYFAPLYPAEFVLIEIQQLVAQAS